MPKNTANPPNQATQPPPRDRRPSPRRPSTNTSRFSGGTSYHAVTRSDGLETTPDVLIARIDGPLFFADADRFRTRIQELTGENGSLTKVVIDAESVHLTDTDGADILIQVASELRSHGASLALAQVHPSTLALWRRAGLIDVVGEGAIFASVRDAAAPSGRPTPAPTSDAHALEPS